MTRGGERDEVADSAGFETARGLEKLEFEVDVAVGGVSVVINKIIETQLRMIVGGYRACGKFPGKVGGGTNQPAARERARDSMTGVSIQRFWWEVRVGVMEPIVMLMLSRRGSCWRLKWQV